MNKKQIKYSFQHVLNAASSVECEGLHHSTKHQHDSDVMCPAKYELDKHINLVRKYLSENEIEPR